jgi:phosphinothricin acetyltransferase
MGPALGWKFGRWVDIVWMTLPLNGGSNSAADAPGLRL